MITILSQKETETSRYILSAFNLNAEKVELCFCQKSLWDNLIASLLKDNEKLIVLGNPFESLLLLSSISSINTIKADSNQEFLIRNFFASDKTISEFEIRKLFTIPIGLDINDKFDTTFPFICGKIGKCNVTLLNDNVNDAEKLISRNYIIEKTDSNIQYIKFFGIDSKTIISKLDDINKTKSVRVFCFDNAINDSTLVIVSDKDGSKVIEKIVQNIYLAFNENIYANENITLPSLIVKLLTIRNKTLSIAESLTGGLLSSKIVDINGASKVLLESAVTYSNQAKSSRLFVPNEMLEKYDAVSKEVAYAMVKGLMETTNADYFVSTTGYAGPTTNSISSPVGLTFIGYGNRENIIVKKFIFSGNRQEIREKTAMTALFLLAKYTISN